MVMKFRRDHISYFQQPVKRNKLTAVYMLYVGIYCSKVKGKIVPAFFKLSTTP